MSGLGKTVVAGSMYAPSCIKDRFRDFCPSLGEIRAPRRSGGDAEEEHQVHFAVADAHFGFGV